jgi:hypothetical protein
MSKEPDEEVVKRVLMERLAKLDKEREAIFSVLSILGGTKGKTLAKSGEISGRGSASLHARIVDATVNLSKIMGKPVSISEILIHLDDLAIELEAKNERAFVAGILSREVRRKEHSRISKKGRGLFEAL